jgi:hypothetical protein
MNGTKQRSTLGAISAILIGMLDVLLVLYVVAIPADQRFDMGQFFINYAENPLGMSVAWIILATTSILALAVVPAAGNLVRPKNEEWVRFASTLGIVGFAVAATSFLTMLGRAPGLAQAYVEGDRVTKAAIAAVGLPELDPLKVLVTGGVGVWYLVVNIVGWRGGSLNKFHALAGIVLALFHWQATLAMLIQAEILDVVAAGAGALLAPTWYVWLGVRLLRAST